MYNIHVHVVLHVTIIGLKLKADLPVIIKTKKITIKNCKYVQNNQSNFDALLGICVRASTCLGGGGGPSASLPENKMG